MGLLLQLFYGAEAPLLTTTILARMPVLEVARLVGCGNRPQGRRPIRGSPSTSGTLLIFPIVPLDRVPSRRPVMLRLTRREIEKNFERI